MGFGAVTGFKSWNLELQEMPENADLGEGFAFNFSLFQPNSRSRERAQSSPHLPWLCPRCATARGWHHG